MCSALTCMKPVIRGYRQGGDNDETGRAHVIWEVRLKPLTRSRILYIENTKVNVPARQVRLVLRTDQVPGFNGSAVCLIGTHSCSESG